jgi:hypothetical protein
VRVLAIFLDHPLLGFALGLGILTIGFVLPLLHLLSGAKLRSLAGNFIPIAGRRQSGAKDSEKNPRPNLFRVHDFSVRQILNLFWNLIRM